MYPVILVSTEQMWERGARRRSCGGLARHQHVHQSTRARVHVASMCRVQHVSKVHGDCILLLSLLSSFFIRLLSFLSSVPFPSVSPLSLPFASFLPLSPFLLPFPFLFLFFLSCLSSLSFFLSSFLTSFFFLLSSFLFLLLRSFSFLIPFLLALFLLLLSVLFFRGKESFLAFLSSSPPCPCSFPVCSLPFPSLCPLVSSFSFYLLADTISSPGNVFPVLKQVRICIPDFASLFQSGPASS